MQWSSRYKFYSARKMTKSDISESRMLSSFRFDGLQISKKMGKLEKIRYNLHQIWLM